MFRFEFPERPFALRKFLLELRFNWNVSLFHYANYGGGIPTELLMFYLFFLFVDTARVLVGIQAKDEDLSVLNEFLLCLGYPFTDESDNYVYKTFLKPKSK